MSNSVADKTTRFKFVKCAYTKPETIEQLCQIVDENSKTILKVLDIHLSRLYYCIGTILSREFLLCHLNINKMYIFLIIGDKTKTNMSQKEF